MKEIKNYNAAKYTDDTLTYKKCEDGIYEYTEDGESLFVTSLSFVQEPELEEGEFADDISQYPLEDVLDKFYCHISDFYGELNTSDSQVCCLEFASPDPEDIRNLRGIIGKHVYNEAYEKDGQEYVKLTIEQRKASRLRKLAGLTYGRVCLLRQKDRFPFAMGKEQNKTGVRKNEH